MKRIDALHLRHRSDLVVNACVLQSDPPVIPVLGATQPYQPADQRHAPDLRLTPDQMLRLNLAGLRCTADDSKRHPPSDGTQGDITR
jgi:hypothetical protein